MKIVKTAKGIRVVASVAILSIMFLFSACGKTKKDDIANDLRENAGMDASAGNATEESQINEIPDTIAYMVEVGGRITTVDAQIYAEGYGNVPIFTVAEYENKDEFVLKYAQKLFDDGEFDNVGPYEILSQEKLEAELQFYKERYAEREDSNTSYLEWLLENYNEDNHEKYSDETIVYTTTNGDDEWVLTYEKARLRGDVDGRLWVMDYSDFYDDFVAGEEIYHNDGIAYLNAYCMDEEYVIESTLGMDETNLNNPCNRESAEAQANQFLKRLGFDNMELLHTVHNKIRGSEMESTVDGYTLIFGMAENGAHLLFAYSPMRTAVEADTQNIVATQPYVMVRVNSNGVYGITIYGNYAEPEVVSEQSQMLSFEQVNEFAKAEFERMINQEFAVYTIGSIEFGYVYITYDEITYAVVPAWRYYDSRSERDTTEKTAVLTICALDGSIIYNVRGDGLYVGGTPY